MFVAIKNSKVAGYSKVEKSGETNGGAWLTGPEGGGFYQDLCGVECAWDGGKSPKDNRSTYIEAYTFSNGYCAFSRNDSCARQGYCALNAEKQTGVADIKAPYQTSKLSASLFAKQTCLDGLTSTESNSENPYTKTAELACVTSTNSGKDIPWVGAFPTTTKDCLYVTPQNPLSLYADGPNFPAVLDSEATGSWCGGRDGNEECIFTETCSGCVVVVPTWYDGCGKASNPDGGPLSSYKTVDPCPIYYYPDCESAYILSKTGNYITTGSKNIGSFSIASVYALSTDKAVEFSMTSGSSSPKINETFTYSNAEVKYTGLKGKESSYTNSYIWLGESGASTSTYKVSAGGYEAGTELVTLFNSGEVKATSKGVLWETTGPGSDPCCNGKQCTSTEVSKATTDTVSAGGSFVFTHSRISTVALGDYVAYQATSIERTDHLAWGEFGYSTEAGGSYKSDYAENEDHKCESVVNTPVLVSVATEGWDRTCFKCVGGNVAVNYWKSAEGTAKCAGINCGCTGASGPQTTGVGPNVKAQTQCYDSCYTNEPCTIQLPPFTFGAEPGTDCCGGRPSYFSNSVSVKVFDNAINRTGNCAIVAKTLYEVAYTQITRAQTLITGIGFEDGGFQVTLQKSEGLYYLDSKGSMQTATSFSLKQSKSDITNSHVNFAFDGAYYNPMGRTTQFGSDGAKKTFIALATADATYLVGSPDGKSKGTATASHDGDVHSYYISDPTAKIWNQASWPGHGVVNGKITTGTFSYSFNKGAFNNSYGASGSLARFLPGAKQTIVAHGGLNVISSKDKVSEKSFKTAYSTKAFSTSFDSSYKGAWIAKAVPYTYVATKSVGWDTWNEADALPVETNHVISINCSGCGFSQPGIPIPLIGDTATYFIRGDKSLIYNKNAASYLWTHPAFKKKWGDGHAGECDAGE